MTLERALKIFNRFSHRGKSSWVIEGVEPKQFISDAGTNPKFNEFESKAIAQRILERNAKTITPREEVTTIDVSKDADDDKIKEFVLYNSEGVEVSRFPFNSEKVVANLPEGSYKLMVIYEDLSTRIEDYTVTK